MMKKIVLAALATLFFITAAQTQPDRMGARQERIEQYKIAFFTEKLQLTPQESKAFWPLFEQFEREQEMLRSKYDLRGKKLELLSDDEVKAYIMDQLEVEHEMAKLRKDYTMEFMEVLPVRKVAMLQRVNREFKKTLLKEMRERRQRRMGN